MAKCNNCGKNLSCSCQVRIALDKKQCCTSCVGNYNQQLQRDIPNRPNNNIPPNVPNTGTNLWHQ